MNSYGKKDNKMKDELANQLAAKYPKIFVDWNKSEMETCLFWGLGVPDNCYEIMDELFLLFTMIQNCINIFKC